MLSLVELLCLFMTEISSAKGVLCFESTQAVLSWCSQWQRPYCPQALSPLLHMYVLIAGKQQYKCMALPLTITVMVALLLGVGWLSGRPRCCHPTGVKCCQKGQLQNIVNGNWSSSLINVSVIYEIMLKWELWSQCLVKQMKTLELRWMCVNMQHGLIKILHNSDV